MEGYGHNRNGKRASEIENSVHWISDIASGEDESRIRKGNAPENFAIPGHIAMNLPEQETSVRGGVGAKRLRAGWDNEYLLKVLNIRNNQNLNAFAL